MRQRRNVTVTNYWESATDAVVGLMMLVLLCLLLVILTMQIQYAYDENTEVEGEGPYVYEDTADYDWDDAHRDEDNFYDDYEHYTEPWHDSDGGGGGGGGGTWETVPQFEFEYEGTVEESGKSAVLVRVIDADTEKNIQEEGVSFEIVNSKGELLTLSTHYPKIINYNKFATDEKGQFYLPEKIAAINYTLHQLTEVNGYDFNEGVSVQIDANYDWDDPMIVTVPLFPSRNTVRIHLTDDSKHPISGSIGVYAKTDIMTFDGTLRLEKDALADTVHLDENGYGESVELYLGEYYLMALSIPEGFVEQELSDFTLLRKNGEKNTEILEISLPFTTVALTLRDAHTGRYIQDTEFSLYSEKSRRGRKLTSNEQGTIIAQGLTKNTTYRLRQATVQEGYHIQEEEFVFYVDEVGLINGLPQYNIDTTNYTIRCAFTVRDALLRKPVSNCALELVQNDALVNRWNVDGTVSVEGLEDGSYTIRWAGNEELLTVLDTEEVQEITLSVWTRTDTLLTAAAAVLGCGILASGVRVVWRKKGKRESA